ncbi:uncharacterized protein EDB93DRAFT_198425 [Suillus bovinus]|uniref:uncharacterized protein n=1 Tax=Suillus bovinus TaxID=48563 RepID=UPI001B873AAD|nr:uncharacterized protein EDB93DRAFT_198425 [Suillus bovinus]KAG2127730.1 hypothetical protein EDB93DRAFT_198425 [Suillus bovinus]
MSGTKPILAHRQPVSVLVNEEGLIAPEAIGPSKFAVTWSAEPPPPVLAPLVQVAERQVVLSSSDGESDFSEKDLCSLGEKQLPADLSDEFESSLSQRFRLQQLAPHHHDENPIIPRLSRATSMPLPSQLEHLNNPRRTAFTSPEKPSQPLPTDAPVESSRFHELSLELADSVQMVVQTLLQVSPTQVLDPAKEQFAACSLSIPTACMSAVLTTMKNLNYISANMSDLCADTFNPAHSSNSTSTIRRLTLPGPPVTPATDFDIAEMLQGVGDASSGRAAEVGVDLVLFHNDVGMRHIAVKGVECGISNVLTHVVRQIINIARRGDSIDLGLSIASSSYLGSNMSPSTERPSGISSPIPIDEDETLQCTFEIHHRFHSPDVPMDDMTPTNTNLSDVLDRPEPKFDSMLFRRLLLRCGASLSSEVPDEKTSRRTYEVKLELQRGSPDAITAKSSAIFEQSHVLLSGVRLGMEPSLEELAQFAETLRGKKVTLYASSASSFAHHLTSYLTAWGLDVSHVSPDVDVDGTPGANEAPAHLCRERGSQEPRTPTANGTPRLAPSLSFVMIDDDVSVLRERLRKYRAEQPIPLSLHSRKRPSLAAHHRPKSSPQVARTLGFGSQAPPQQTPVVVVHFTSLANYKLVKEIIQCDLASHSYPACPPEVMIIPKPAGPRRFLTALHTAVTKPIVDPFFSPIATSPLSPGSHSSPFFNLTQTSPKSPSSRPSNSSRSNSERSARSTRDSTSEHHPHAPPSPLGLADNMEYFPETQSPVRLGQTPSSGLVISSPDGQPTGIIFQPRAKSKPITPSPNSVTGVTVDRDKSQFLLASSERLRSSSTRRLSDSEQKKQGQSPLSFASLHSNVLGSASPPRREASPIEGFTSISTAPKVKGKGATSPQADELTPSSPLLPSSLNASAVDLRKISSPPSSPVIPEPQPSVLARRPGRRANHDAKPSTPPTALGKAGKGQPDASIIPPISVLIVDDNPINQTILSTFMRRKKIKYDVAKNGEEAVQKWQNGGFHLILMDIQMPVMDGIQATKEIRRLESLTASSGYTPGTPLSDTLSEGAFSESRTSASPYRSAVIIVALTASSLQSDRVAALAAGCNDFLTKPVSLEWLNNKIIEWGSIKALQMWADLRPEVVKTISTEQTAQAQLVARRLHVPEGRTTPVGSVSRSSSKARGDKRDPPVEPGSEPTTKLADPKGEDKPTSKLANDLPDNDSPGSSPSSESSDSFEQSGENSASLPAAHNNDTDDAVTQSESTTAKDEHTPTGILFPPGMTLDLA